MAVVDCNLQTSNLSTILEKYQKSPSFLLEILTEAQAHSGYLSREVLQVIAEELGITESKVFGVATFYSLFKTAPTGRHMIRICESAIEDTIGIKPGETTPDGKFTLEFTSCLGLCGVAPAIMIGDQVFGNLTPARVREILSGF